MLHRLSGYGDPTPTPTLVFLTAAVIALLQIPSMMIMNKIGLTLGIAINELAFVMGIPIFLACIMHFDRTILFPHTNPPIRIWIPLAVLIIGIVIVIDYSTYASELVLPLPQQYQDALDRVMAVSNAAEYAHKFVLLCILPAVCEEIFFRGFCQNTLETYWGKTLAIIVTGALFALLHANPWHAHLYFLLGCFLSWTYAVSRTLWIPIACHLFNNAWTFTNHTLGTTPPIEGEPLVMNMSILIFGITCTLLGGRWFTKRNTN